MRNYRRVVPRALHRLGGFGSSIVLMAVINVSVIPIVISLAGATVWGGIAVAQSIAAFGAIIVAFGWGTTGPSDVARLSHERRGQFYVDSVSSRVWLFAMVLPAVLAIVWYVAPADHLANACAAVALLMPALGASWFFIGEKSPWRLLLFENAPRAIGTIIGALFLVTLGNVAVFTAAQALGALASVVVGWINVTGRYRNYVLSAGPRAAALRLPQQAGGMITASTAALYVNLPLVLVSLVVPGATAAYAVADKLLKFALTAFSPITQVAQGYVPSTDPEKHLQRAKVAAISAATLGVIAGSLYAMLAPWAAHLLSAHKIEISGELSIPLGVALASIATSGIVGLACLTSFGAIKRVAMSTILGALAGVPLLIVSGVVAGAVGIAWATASSELLVTAYQLFYFRRLASQQSVPRSSRRNPLPK